MSYALTDWQPWASLIMAGVKPVENRSWPVPSTLEFPFRLGIHAGQRWDTSIGATRAWEELAHLRGISWEDGMAALMESTPVGALLGFVTVTGCHPHHPEFFGGCRDDAPEYDPAWEAPTICSPWAEPGCWHWQLADPEPLDEPAPMPGRQRLWRLGWEPDQVFGGVIA